MAKRNVVRDKSYEFALLSIGLYKRIVSEQREFVISKQFLRSATSIGANVEEAIAAQSTKDFIAKLSIAFKEARETVYWINLLEKAEWLPDKEYSIALESADELCRIIASIIKTTKGKL